MAFIRACLSRVILKGITSMSVVKESKREGEKEAPLYVLISREIVHAGVDKLPDYLRSDTKDVIRGKKSFVFFDSG
uniref:Uncharacterized protein n=1 Tax=Gadus morhua TaxID=8049 RepID=A0A8C5C199_GADMO